MAEYKGAASEGNRALHMQKRRERAKEQMAEMRAKIVNVSIMAMIRNRLIAECVQLTIVYVVLLLHVNIILKTRPIGITVSVYCVCLYLTCLYCYVFCYCLFLVFLTNAGRLCFYNS